MVWCLDDAVHDGVAEVHVGVCHVDFGAQHTRSFLEFSGVHAHEQIEVLLHAAVAVRAFGAGLGGCAFLRGYLFGSLVVDIRFPFFYEAYSQIKELWKIVGGIVFAVSPVETEPFDVLAYGIDILHIFLYGVGVVETQVACPSEFFSDAEVHADCFGVSYVQVAVRLGWEPGVEASAILPLLEIVFHDLFYEIEALGLRHCIFVTFHLCENVSMIRILPV